MKRRFLHGFFLLFTLFVLRIETVSGQGCSDAGICSLESIKPGMKISDTQNQFSVGIGYGNADYGIRVITPYLAYTRTFNKFKLEGRLTSISQSGEETSVYGLSDLFLLLNYDVLNNMQATVGLKLPLMDGNRLLDGLPLPMDYQSSLGTVDLLLGLAYHVGKLQLAAAYQQPLNQNSNTFLAEEFPAESGFSRFQSTNNYYRRGDLMLRVSYPIQTGDKLTLTPSLLPIYHLGDDRYADLSEQEQVITGSEGLTFNVNLYVDIPVGDNDNLQFNLGAPLVARQARPDGLTRSFVANFEYQIKF